MNLGTTFEQNKDKIIEILNQATDKTEGLAEAVNMLVEASQGDLIQRIQEESARAEHDKEYRASLGLRKLSKEEETFYQRLKEARQGITAEQIDIIPTTTIDRTLEDIKKDSGVLKIVEFAPADVKKWIVADKSGIYKWGPLTSSIVADLEANIKTLNMEVSKMYVGLIIPKAIQDLSLPFVDRYFTAILKETCYDGLEYGFLLGTGKDEPIGVYKLIEQVNTDRTHKDKPINTITSFTPKALAPVKKYLSKNGKRTLGKLYLICNPVDRYDYVDPAMLDYEGRNVSSYKNMEVLESINNPQGKAIFIIPKKYTMGMNGMQVHEYKETRALEDEDLIIAKCYANGRATDDYVAYVINPTKLEEYIPVWKQAVSEAIASEATAGV